MPSLGPLLTTMSTKNVADRKFTPESIAAVFCSVDIPGSSPAERRAAARGVLRHKQHTTHPANLTKGGFHPSYIELHGRGQAKGGELQDVKTVLNDTFSDLLDTVSLLIVRLDSEVSSD